MTEPRIDKQEQRPSRPRPPVIRRVERVIDGGVKQERDERVPVTRKRPDVISDSQFADQSFADQRPPVIRSDESEVGRVTQQSPFVHMPVAINRPDVEASHTEDNSVTLSLRDRLGGSMTKITDFYRRSNKIDAESQRKAGRRVFRLKGYTTVGKINRKFKQERQQRALRNILTTLMVILLLIILFVIYNPFKDMSEFRKISGEDSLYKNRTTTTILSEETTENNVNP